MRLKFLYINILLFAFFYNYQTLAQKTVNVSNFQIVTNDTSTDYINNAKGIFTITASSTKVTCFGDSDGTITVNIIGAGVVYPVDIRLRYPDLSYNYFNGLNAVDFPFTITGLYASPSPYQVRVKDADNIPAQYQYSNVYVLAPAELEVQDYTLVNETCPGICDGSIQINSVVTDEPPVTYLWTGGSTSDNIANLCANIYNVTITDNHSCSKIFTYPITAPPTIIVDSLVFTPVFCVGGSGSVTVYASGGSGALTYNIGTGWQASNTFSGLAAGTYTVSITDGICNGFSNPFTFTENPAIILSAVVDSVNCLGGSDGSINLTVAGGTGPYTFSWSNGATTEDILGLIIGNYCVTVTDFYSCTSTACFDVYEPAVITITETHVNPCFGASNGSIDITVSGGSCSNYTYLWSSGPTTQDLNGIPQGSYTVTVTDCNGCTNTLSITLTQNPQITITETHVNYDCFGSACMGSINITVTGGTPCPGYTYLWSNGSTSEDLSNLCIGSYTVTATDCASCTITNTISITRPADITINLVLQTNVTCFGLCNGAIDINPTGGTPVYTYLWTSGSSSQDINGLCAGSYTVTVTDSKGCTKTRTFVITQPPDITITPVLITNVSCNGACNGAIDLTVGGGTPGYTYLWSGPSSYSSTSLDLINLCAGVYNLTVTDSKPCTKTYSVTITEPAAITTNITSQTNPTCTGLCNGTATISAGGGNPGYTYLWCNGQSTITATNLCAGTCGVTVTDASSCTKTNSVILIAPVVVTASITSQTPVSCNGSCNGTATVTAGGGTGIYTYTWCNSQITQTATGLCVGPCTVTITDSNGCSTTATVTITAPAVLSASISSQTNDSCNGSCDGTATVAPVGGNAPYTYLWCNGQTTITATGLCVGVCTVTVTDANLCTTTTTVTISEPTLLTATITAQTNVLCFGQCNGMATVTAGGGTGLYTYLWCNGQTTASATNICAGTCTVTVTDSNLCTATTTVTITPAVALTVDTLSQTNVSCNGFCDGTVTVVGNGGTSGYSYLWCNGQTTVTSTNLCAGVCGVTITDANGCTATNSVTITEPNALSISLVSQTNVTCNGLCDGTAQINVLGGTIPYSYNWCNGQTTSNVSGLCAGNCTVTVTDANLCTITYTVTITQSAILTASISSQTDISCGGACTGTATVTTVGGTAPYIYLWCNGQTTNPAISLCAGVCCVTVTDTNGCTATTCVTITAPPPFTAVISDSTMSCGSFPTVVAGTMFIPDGNGASYSTSINQIDFPPSATINSASDISSICLNMEHSWLGDIEIKITCPNGQSAILKQDSMQPGFEVFLGIPNETDGANPFDPAQNPSGTGWDYCFSTTPTYGTMVNEANNYHDLPAGVYTPYQSFNNLIGCPLDGNWTVSVIDNWGSDNGYIFSWLINFDPSTYPYQYCNGSATVSTVGGLPPFTYFWSSGETTDTITNKCSGNYCVTVTDANGCSDSTCVTIVDVNLNITSFTKTDASCNGVCDGSATVNSSGGYAPISYAWSNGGTTQTINNLCAGQYIVIVTEGNGCEATDTVTITNLYAITANTNIVSPVSCNGTCDGSALATISNPGSPPYSYLWFNGDTTAIADSLCAGTYIVTVSDINTCSTTASVTLNAPIVLSASITSQINVSCNGSCDGSATVTAVGGTIPYTYLWSCGGQTTNPANSLCAGVCTVTVSDANGCTATASVTITEPTVLTSSISSQTNVSCNGLCDGSATITANGGTAPYTYLWNPSGQVTQTATNLCAGTYIITISDAHGCTTTASVTITQPAVVTSSISSQTNVTCNGLCNGTATVTGNGGTPGYTYLWSCSGQTTQTATNLCAGICTVTVTDLNGCTSTATVTITEPTTLTSSFTAFTQVGCAGSCTGSLTITPSGGSGSYTYTWSPPVGNTQTINNLCAGIYDVTVTDSLGCTTTNSFEITDTSNLSLTLVSTINPTCFGLCDGSATVIANGGFPPYSYVWNTSPVQNGPFANNLCDNIYTVMVQDTALCSRQLNVTITEPAILSFTTSVTNPVCNSDCNGTATATLSGGTLPYSYLWDNGDTTSTADSLCAGTFGITVSDVNLCPVAPQTVTIITPPILTATLVVTQNISCNGVCNGILTANTSGGVAPYTYVWSSNATDTIQFADSLCSGIYSVTVTDSSGCTVVANQTLNTPSPVIATITSTTMVGCHGNCSGTATVAGSGGTAPYSYIWCNGDTIVTADSLCAGFCGVTITDFNGCTGTTTVNIIDTSNLDLDTVSITQPLCFGQCNGSVTVIATGGYPPYTYLWSDGQTGATAIGLCSGNITVTVFDGSLCSRTLIFNLSNPPQLTDIVSFIPTTCSSICDGTGIVSANGGTGLLSFVWSDAFSQTNDTATSLCAGQYFVTISDNNNCSLIDSVDITSPPSISLILSEVSPITCYNSCNGIMTASVLGGTPPYNYLWSNSSINDTISGLCAGTYILTVTDFNLCQVVDSITITQPDSLQLSFINVTQIACGGGNCTGEATAQVSGGTFPYIYIWDINANTGDTLYADSLCGNIYFLTVTDFNGCIVIDSVAIIDTSNLSISIIDTNMVTCFGSCDGSATVDATGGYPPYVYLWSCGGQTTATATNLCQGICFVTVTDSLLCSRVAMVTITDAAALTVTDSIIPISCTGLCDASIILIPSGGTPGYSFLWSNSSINDTINGLCPGTYYYTVTDNNSCIFTDSVTIIDPGTMQANLSIVNPILCHGVCIGSIISNPTGSFGYTYLWSNGDTTQTISNLCGGWYIVTITGTGLCSVIDSINLPEPDSMLVSFTNILQVNCGGDCSGTVEAVATDGTSPYTYQWDANAGNSINPFIDSLCANIYFITVTDANSCSQTLNFEVTDTSNMSVLVTDSMMISCFGRCDGWATITASGGTLPYSYLWNNTPIADTTFTADSLCAGMYLVTVSDLNLCSRVKLVNITQPDSLYAIISDSLSVKCNADCNGSLTVSIIGGTPLYSLLWNNSSIDSIIQNLCVGTYYLTVTDSHGCQDSINYSLTSPPSINTTLTANGALCSNGTNDGSITTIISGGVSPYNFLWSNADTTQDIVGLNYGNYWLSVTDSLGCIKVDSATIGASIIVNATAKWDTTLCYGDSVQIFGFGGNVYTWSPTTGLNDSTIFDPWARPIQTTTYYFTAWDSICFDIDSVIIQVHPQIIVNAGLDQTILAEHSATLTAVCSDPFATFLWYPTTGLSDSTNSTTIATPLSTTSYIAYATNSFGCVESDTVVVTVIPKIIIPTGITPNGDGSNDVWIIDLLGYYPNIEVEVYNRWGEKLFYSKGYPDSERWDGTFKGKPLPTGTYYYIINLHDEFDTKPITGPITIMR